MYITIALLYTNGIVRILYCTFDDKTRAVKRLKYVIVINRINVIVNSN